MKKDKRYIPNAISSQVLMHGVYYRNNAPGGMAAVVQSYEKYFEKLNYITTWKDGNFLVKLYFFIKAYILTFFILLFDKKKKLVHIHTAADASFYRKMYFVKLAKFFNRKAMLHVHASRFKDFYNESSTKKQEQIIEYLKMVDLLIVLSESWKQWFIEIGVSKEKIKVLNNIVDYPAIQPFKKQEEKIHFLFSGDIRKIENEIQYDKVDEKLTVLRSESLQFLKKSLELAKK